VQYQNFRGSDVRQALDKVRATLGRDALIQSIREVGQGGPVEVTAGLPFASAARWPFASESAFREPERTSKSRRPAVRRAPNGPLAIPSSVEQELHQLRSMLDELNATRPPRERAMALLHAAGIEGKLARELVSGAGRGPKKNRDVLKRWLVERLSGQIRVQPGLIAQPGPLLISCVGPTGVGKTTTLAKLAAQARLELSRSVSVVSLDNYRVGAVEQWQRYSTLMGIPFTATQDPQTFARVVGESRAEIVLVDTAGRSGHEVSPLSQCLARVSGRQQHTLLVLPAWLRAPDAERVVSLYTAPAPTSLVATKLDETHITGGLLHAALPTGLPFSYLCSGPRVPEDIDDASVQAVLTAVFREN